MFYVNNISYGYYEWNNNVNNEIFKKNNFSNVLC